ncbi:LPXTG cell wall anchor domain-containing protein [Streptomyces sp. MS1.AVA.1]|uniref:LPXTG cell wall anchor domain-containing protein n=1 Tax=Streptomyces machairae TaxID=3134109 RepID=A0ABU8UMB9_9ACTN
MLDGSSVGSLKAKASVDVKLRLKVDADIPAGQGAVFVSADYINADESCGGYPDLDHHEFQILAKTDPGNDEAVNGTGGSDSGSLAETGSSDALSKVALAGGAALMLGAGAVVVARRRNADTNA